MKGTFGCGRRARWCIGGARHIRAGRAAEGTGHAVHGEVSLGAPPRHGPLAGATIRVAVVGGGRLGERWQPGDDLGDGPKAEPPAEGHEVEKLKC